jgi:phosphoglycerate kinase
MNGLGMLVPSHFIERNTIAEVQQFIQVAGARGIPIYYPTDMLCVSNDDNEKLEIFNSTDLSCGDYC